MKSLLVIWIFLLVLNDPVLAFVKDGIDPVYSYLRAKQLAEDHQKSYILYFSAEWCVPCSFLEETTFQDKGLQEFIDKNHFFVKLDIDQFEGYALKEYYGVYSLPTFLVLTPEHKLVKRKEGALSPSVLIDLLSNDKNSYSTSFSGSSVLSNYSPKTFMNGDVQAHSNDDQIGNELPENNIVQRMFSLQMGAFASYENAKQHSIELKQYTEKDVQIISDLRDETYIYIVYLGRFESPGDADILLSILESYGLSGMVKSISTAVKT